MNPDEVPGPGEPSPNNDVAASRSAATPHDPPLLSRLSLQDAVAEVWGSDAEGRLPTSVEDNESDISVCSLAVLLHNNLTTASTNERYMSCARDARSRIEDYRVDHDNRTDEECEKQAYARFSAECESLEPKLAGSYSTTERQVTAAIVVGLLLALSALQDRKYIEVKRLQGFVDRRVRDKSGHAHMVSGSLPFKLLQLYCRFAAFGAALDQSNKQAPTISELYLRRQLNASLDSFQRRRQEQVDADANKERARRLEDAPNAQELRRWFDEILFRAIDALGVRTLRDEDSEFAQWVVTNSGGTDDSRAYRQYLELARLHYTMDDLAKAIKFAHAALNYAPPPLEQFILEARRFLDYLTQESASRESNREEAVRIVEERSEGIQERLEGEVRQTIGRSLVPVVEVLGVFLAVAGIVATSVGGITASDAREALVIFGLGFGSVVLLFALLRLIVDRDIGKRWSKWRGTKRKRKLERGQRRQIEQQTSEDCELLKSAGFRVEPPDDKHVQLGDACERLREMGYSVKGGSADTRDAT